MRIRLKGINSKRKKLADGSFRTYYWAWKGGPPLRGEPGTPDFVASYNAAVAQKIAPPRGVLFRLLQQYQDSEDFRLLADSTRRSYIPLIASPSGVHARRCAGHYLETTAERFIGCFIGQT